MIKKLFGKVDEIELGSFILNVSGVGYGVHITNSFQQEIKTGDEISVYIYHVTRENLENLYGFKDKEQLEFFELLLSISGIGPKGALGILNSAPIETIKEGVAGGDASHLTKVSGIGKKSAEKIIIELRDKLGAIEFNNNSNSGGSMAIEALTSLGYSKRDAREAVQKVDRNLKTEDMVKEALKNIN